MKKTLPLIMIFAATMLLMPSCKSKQQITDISGAQIQAAAPTQTTVTIQAEPVQEITRDEKFALATGETNADALKFKYHVVVGSFKTQSNAKGLQNSLNAEGHNSVVVVNETGMFRVIMTSYNEYAQARAHINRILNRFPDSWVLVQK